MVPERAALEKWAGENGVAASKQGDEGFLELLGHPAVSKHYLDEIVAKSREAGFFGFEIPQKVHLTTTAFTPDNDILTPTFKLKRNEAKKYFLSHIKNLYGGAKLQGEE